jgi:hypothetical protein
VNPDLLKLDFIEISNKESLTVINVSIPDCPFQFSLTEAQVDQISALFSNETNSDDEITVFTDAVVHGNPGPAGVSCAFFKGKDQKYLLGIQMAVAEGTNNKMEYLAFVLAQTILAAFGQEKP